MNTSKRLLLLAGLFGLSIYAKAQSNLQFNAAKMIKYNCASGCTTTDSTITVPAGKVWKIENASAMGTWIMLNGNPIGMMINGSTTVYSNNNSPIWLPAGTYTLRFAPLSTSNMSAFVSGIEFNLVP